MAEERPEQSCLRETEKCIICFFFLKGFVLVSTFEEVNFQVLKGLSFDCNVV